MIPCLISVGFCSCTFLVSTDLVALEERVVLTWIFLISLGEIPRVFWISLALAASLGILPFAWTEGCVLSRLYLAVTLRISSSFFCTFFVISWFTLGCLPDFVGLPLSTLQTFCFLLSLALICLSSVILLWVFLISLIDETSETAPPLNVSLFVLSTSGDGTSCLGWTFCSNLYCALGGTCWLDGFFIVFTSATIGLEESVPIFKTGQDSLLSVEITAFFCDFSVGITVFFWSFSLLSVGITFFCSFWLLALSEILSWLTALSLARGAVEVLSAFLLSLNWSNFFCMFFLITSFFRVNLATTGFSLRIALDCTLRWSIAFLAPAALLVSANLFAPLRSLLPSEVHCLSACWLCCSISRALRCCFSSFSCCFLRPFNISSLAFFFTSTFVVCSRLVQLGDLGRVANSGSTSLTGEIFRGIGLSSIINLAMGSRAFSISFDSHSAIAFFQAERK